MEFNSQICTTKEQSERLRSLGLKKETADMVWHYTKSRNEAFSWELKPHSPMLKNTTRLNIEKLNVFGHKNTEGKVMTGEEYFDELWGKDVPAWSLHRLMVLYRMKHVILESEDEIAAIYDEMIGVMEKSIKNGEFNKAYLEE